MKERANSIRQLATDWSACMRKIRVKGRSFLPILSAQEFESSFL